MVLTVEATEIATCAGKGETGGAGVEVVEGFLLDGVDGELQDTLLPFDALRLVEDDGVVDDAVVALADLCRFFLVVTRGDHGQQDQAEDEV